MFTKQSTGLNEEWSWDRSNNRPKRMILLAKYNKMIKWKVWTHLIANRKGRIITPTRFCTFVAQEYTVITKQNDKLHNIHGFVCFSIQCTAILNSCVVLHKGTEAYVHQVVISTPVGASAVASRFVTYCTTVESIFSISCFCLFHFFSTKIIRNEIGLTDQQKVVFKSLKPYKMTSESDFFPGVLTFFHNNIWRCIWHS